METYFCFHCGEVTKDYEDDIIEKKDIEKRDLDILGDYKQKDTNHPIVLCGECTGHYFHTPLCPICHEYGDYCLGHGESEEMSINDGICPLCDEYIGPRADAVHSERNGEEPCGCWCHGHSLQELRDYHEQGIKP